MGERAEESAGWGNRGEGEEGGRLARASLAPFPPAREFLFRSLALFFSFFFFLEFSRRRAPGWFRFRGRAGRRVHVHAVPPARGRGPLLRWRREGGFVLSWLAV